MKKLSSSRSSTAGGVISKGMVKTVEGMKFTDCNLVPISPLKQQFEPTAVHPVRQRKVMGGSVGS